MSLADRFITHQVENQPPPLAPYDAYSTDIALREALSREGGEWAEADVAACGRAAGGELMELGVLANQNKPNLHTHDRFGHRLDAVEFHPAYHRLMARGVELGVPSFAWRHEDRRGAHVARAALAYLFAQPDQGTSCPLTMTYACVPALRHEPELAAQWLPRVTSLEYDPQFIPAWNKAGNTIGMGMTEKQGGSDVRSNTTRAYPLSVSGSEQWFELVGHKWFFSAPMCDAFLVLAQADAGLTCFLLPRFKPDGGLNDIRIQRLKDKLGDWSNASSEIELQGALAQRIGEEGRGIATIIEMVALTRQDCIITSSGIMRQALVQAIHHTRHRSAFGKALINQPAMQNVLADLALESEAAMALSLRVARAVDARDRDAREAAFARIALGVGKYFVCKRCVPFVNEAQECLGGAGYVEESILPRLYRQAPLNSIWEGSGNIQCLDVLRALHRDAETRTAFLAELEAAAGAHPLLDAEIRHLRAELDAPTVNEAGARALVERMAIALQSSLLLRAGNDTVASLFCAARLGGARRLFFGTLPTNVRLETIVERAFPDFR